MRKEKAALQIENILCPKSVLWHSFTCIWLLATFLSFNNELSEFPKSHSPILCYWLSCLSWMSPKALLKLPLYFFCNPLSAKKMRSVAPMTEIVRIATSL